MKALILGAGRRVHLPSAGPTPKCLVEGPAGWRGLDWLLTALREGGRVDEVVFVGGDGIEQVQRSYPDLRYVYNEGWADQHVVGSLFAAEAELDGPFFFSYADVVHRPAAVDALRRSEAEIAILVDPRWRERQERLPASLREAAELVVAEDGRVRRVGKGLDRAEGVVGQFVGLARFGHRGAAELRHAYHSLRCFFGQRPLGGGAPLDRACLSDLLQEMILEGVPVHAVPTEEAWAEIDAPRDLARFVFGTKAETLDRLRPLLQAAQVVEGVWLRVGEWQEDRRTWSRRLQRRFGGTPLAVRSSALHEDGLSSSAAGRYQSVLGVDPDEPGALDEAVEKVVASYRRDGGDPSDQILVQPLLVDVAMSGVLMTRDLDTGADYTVIHFDESGATDAVTAGRCAGRTVRIWRGREAPTGDTRLDRLRAAAAELEAITGTDALDVEFAFTRNGDLHLLQVRPIAAAAGWAAVDQEAHRDELERLRDFVARLLAPAPGVAGATTVLGQMPDWNPAEMIGRHPAPLALSLYERLITDGAWRRARARLGYGEALGHRLMVNLAGRPYIDVRASAHNLLPAGLDPALRGRVVDAALSLLRSSPQLHDKIEFEVLPTALDLGTSALLERLGEHGLARADRAPLHQALRRLGRRILGRGAAAVDETLSLTAALAPLRREILAGAGDPADFPRRVAWLLDATVERGTEPFSILARQAFVATALLRSLVAAGVLAEEELRSFLASVRTVSGELAHDLARLGRGEVPRETILRRYGHLRPGSYDILSPRYDAAPELYLPGDRPTLPGPSPRDFALSPARRREVDRALASLDLGVDAAGLLDFAAAAIAGREEAKFRFTACLSDALELLARWGASLGLDREEVAHLEIDEILAWARRPQPARLGDELARRAARARLRRERAARLLLPSLITGPDDLEVVVSAEERPNFVGEGRVTAPARLLEGPAAPGSSLQGRIVLIEGADPGYDWLFAQRIAGLVTCYGGANSHMTIRCCEFGLPAAVGCGPELFGRLKAARSIVLDPVEETLRAL